MQWLLAYRVLFAHGSRLYLAFAVAFFLYYLFIVLARRSSSKFRSRWILNFTFVSSLICGVALGLQHWNRNMRFAHLREEVRVYYAAISLVLIALLNFPGRKYLPAYLVEAFSLLSYALLWACSGHEHFL